MFHRRFRRGGNAIEIALTMPLFLVAIFSLIDYAWYFYTEAMTIEATRQGCRVGAVTPGDPADQQDAAHEYIEAELARLGVAQSMTLSTSAYSGSPSDDTVNLYVSSGIIECDAQIGFQPLVGMIPMPDYVVSSATFSLEQPATP